MGSERAFLAISFPVGGQTPSPVDKESTRFYPSQLVQNVVHYKLEECALPHCNTPWLVALQIFAPADEKTGFDILHRLGPRQTFP